MYVMGLNCSSHDSGAALLHADEGKLAVVAVSEARLNRIKHNAAFPLLSITYCLQHFGIALADVAMVCIDRLDCSELFLGRTRHIGAGEAIPKDARVFRGGLRINNDFSGDASGLMRFGVDRDKVKWIDHIDAHAASAYYCSPFDEAAVLCVDAGLGIYRGRGSALLPIDRMGYFRESYHNGAKIDFVTGRLGNIAWFFDNICDALGYHFFAAGKVMAIAAYRNALGGPATEAIVLNKKEIFDFYMDYRHTFIPEAFCRDLVIAQQGGRLSPQAVAVAARAQEIFNEEMVRLAGLAAAKTGSRRLCLAGGSALSCVANGAIRRAGAHDDIFIQPASSDEGIPLGCALYGYHALAGGTIRQPMTHAYLGRAYDSDRLASLLRQWGLRGRPVEAAEVARLLAEGKIIGRCFGAAEYGPRALGNRSILADPRQAGIRDRINRDVKHREGFRPFAPSVLEGRQGEYFVDSGTSPFMLVATSIRPEWAGRLPGIIHVDGSSRFQTVGRDANPAYWELINEFGRLTGVYCLLNTSFNDNDEPIVETYEDAIVSFEKTNIDHLYVDGILIDRPPQGFREISKRLQRMIEERCRNAWEAAAATLCRG